MPTYAYRCTNPECAHTFDVVQAFTDAAVTECPVCGQPVRKVYGSVGVVFKGSGFYRNDSRSGSEKGGSDTGSEKGSEKSSSDTGKASKNDAGSGAAKEKSSSSDSGSSTKAASTSGSGASGSSSGSSSPAPKAS